ncbi:MAG: DMT family transporter [Zoogloeaceae bacterium]|jgi:drug/metabolite transporter (DMT)-like permease|nr:DMT family transporter [Rhodocyclaceae bacterium]MCP5239038.1 DMT family transporter [Zoogloeaceae bacterium]MCP5254074.1 DMT family transporter [Zoogloeaceae bacterium]MCP5295249.1 DMT family transporter [Zoogloeaceae bacterium]MCW5613690.1 DMT family transporter [Rhodocyclaceae bacterium]
MRRLLDHPYLLLTLTVLFWSGNMVAGRGLREAVPPFSLAAIRWSIALLLTLPFALPHLRAQWKNLRASWPAILFLGLAGICCYNAFAYLALSGTTATNAALLNSFIPICTVAISWAFFGKRLTLLEALGVLISLCGVLMIISRGEPAMLASLSLNRGDLWMLTAVLFWAMYTVGLSWRPGGVEPMLMLAAFIVCGLMALIPAAIVEHANGLVISLTPGSIAGILYIGIFPSFLGYIFYNRGIALVGANKGALFIHLMPVFGTLLAAVFLDERPAWFHYVGIALIFSGIFLNTRRVAS